MSKEKEKVNAYAAIDAERLYQDLQWPRSRPLHVLGEINLLRRYLLMFDTHYAQGEDDSDYDVPIQCMHDIRKMAAILVRCIEHHKVPARGGK